MYQTEINGRVEAADGIPREVLRAFGARRDTVTARSVLSWSEHCTECAAPACYQTCDLFEARPRDMRCRRFVEGMVRIDNPDGLLPYILKIKFKRWGKLWSLGSTRLFSIDEANTIETRDRMIGGVLRTLPLHLLPLPSPLKKQVMQKRYGDKKKFAAVPNEQGTMPNLFLIECYNPNKQTINATFSIATTPLGAGPIFNKLIEFLPGFNRCEVPVSEIATQIDLRKTFDVSIVPNEIAEGTLLYFGITEFVRDTSVKLASTASDTKPRDCKCIVWDLDNTIWQGTLIEDGLEGVTLKPGVVELIKHLDSRGMLHSVASKNDPQLAMQALEKFGIAEYFLCPQVSWGPKGRAVRRIAEILNIGTDTLLFVDDQPFEREEVAVTVPEVRTLDALDFAQIAERPDCQGSATEDAARRRHSYIEQVNRQEALLEYGEDDYLSFLKSCGIELIVRPMDDTTLERVHELAQRTNQLNFSGNRYSREQLVQIMDDANLHTYVLDCRDKFGNYGTVGFCIVNAAQNRMIDLAFSCRVQNKRVEHAFMGFLLARYLPLCDEHFLVNYRKTERNAPQGRVFDDLGFQLVADGEGALVLGFPKHLEIPDDGIIAIQEPAAVDASSRATDAV